MADATVMFASIESVPELGLLLLNRLPSMESVPQLNLLAICSSSIEIVYELDLLAICSPSTLKSSQPSKYAIHTFMNVILDHNRRLTSLLSEEKSFQTINSQLTYEYVAKPKLLYDHNRLDL